MKKAWKDSNRLREDFAQDKKEYDYLNSTYRKKQGGRNQKMDELSNEQEKIINEIIDKLNEIFKAHDCSDFSIETDGAYKCPMIFLCHKGSKDFAIGYAITLFNPNNATNGNFEHIKNRVIEQIFNRRIHRVEAEKDIEEVQKTIDAIKGIAADINKEIRPLAEQGKKANDMYYNVLKSRGKIDYTDVSKAYMRAEDSYKKEHPVAPGEVVVWNLQSGKTQTVEVMSIDDSTQTAKVKTDGGSMRRVPLSRLSPNVKGNLG